MERYRKANKSVQYGQVVFAGSSLMEMFPINKLLKEHDDDDTIIYNRGSGGFVTWELMGVRIYLTAYYPVNFEAASESMKECLKIRTNEKINAANAEVEKLAKRHGQKYNDVNEKLKDEQGRLKAEYTIEGMHIYESGHRAIYEDVMKYVRE